MEDDFDGGVELPDDELMGSTAADHDDAGADEIDLSVVRDEPPVTPRATRPPAKPSAPAVSCATCRTASSCRRRFSTCDRPLPPTASVACWGWPLRPPRRADGCS